VAINGNKAEARISEALIRPDSYRDHGNGILYWHEVSRSKVAVIFQSVPLS